MKTSPRLLHHSGYTKFAATLLFAVLIVLLPPAGAARADVAPPAAAPGANPGPGVESTQVRMLSETVLIDVPLNPPDQLGQAQVSADFHMLNLGALSETLNVRFPVSNNDGFYNYPEIHNLRVSVDGRPLATHPTQLPDPIYGEQVKWVEFEVTFPPAEDVLLNVSYTLDGSGEYPFVSYAYLLETGAGWQGTIGTADLIVRLPYAANPSNVFIDSSPGWGGTSPGATLTGRDVRWHYAELEPTRSDNLSIAMVWPSAWNQALQEEARVASNPGDGEAWGRLGKLYKEIAFQRRSLRDDSGGQALFEKSAAAYQQAVTLLPDDALWHLGYAQLLFRRYDIELFAAQNSGTRPAPEVLAGLQRAVEEYHRAYTLAPQNPTVRQFLEDASYGAWGAIVGHAGGYWFPWLTATPTLWPTPTTPPSATPQPQSSATLPPPPASPSPPPPPTVGPAASLPTATVPGSSQNGPSLPCGSIALAPLALLAAALPLSKKRRRDLDP